MCAIQKRWQSWKARRTSWDESLVVEDFYVRLPAKRLNWLVTFKIDFCARLPNTDKPYGRA